MENNIITAILFLFIGSAILIFGVYIYYINRKITKNGVKCKGKIIDIEKKSIKGLQGADELRDIYFMYKVRYTTVSGQQIEKFTNEGVQKEYQIDDEIDIIYNSKNETEFLAFRKSQNTLVYSFVFLGILFILISILFFLK